MRLIKSSKWILGKRGGGAGEAGWCTRVCLCRASAEPVRHREPSLNVPLLASEASDPLRGGRDGSAMLVEQKHQTHKKKKEAEPRSTFRPKYRPSGPFPLPSPAGAAACLISHRGSQWLLRLQPSIKRCCPSFISLMTSSMVSAITSPPSSTSPFAFLPLTPPRYDSRQVGTDFLPPLFLHPSPPPLTPAGDS